MKLNNKGLTIVTVILIVILFFFLLLMVSMMINNLTNELNVNIIKNLFLS